MAQSSMPKKTWPETCKFGSAEEMRDAISHGADIHAMIEAEGLDPLSLASAVNRPDLMRILLDAGADPNSEEGILPAISWAAQQGWQEMLGLILSRPDTKIDALDRIGWTALMWAANQGFEGAVESLIAAGADVDARNRKPGGEDGPPSMLALQADRFQILLRLIEAGCDLDPVPGFAKNAIRRARANGEHGVAEALEARILARHTGGAAPGDAEPRRL